MRWSLCSGLDDMRPLDEHVEHLFLLLKNKAENLRQLWLEYDLISLVWQIPYIYTVIGFSAWAFFGQLVTVDDDMPDGLSNPNGSLPFPWAELVIEGLLFVGLGLLAVLVLVVRAFGGTS
jgi:hypothetical protein